MTYQTKKSGNKSNISFHCLCNTFTFLSILLFLSPLLPGVNDVKAQDSTGEMKADFLFQEPKKYLGFRFGTFIPEADSGLFDMITRELTIEKNDFRAWDFGIDVGLNIHKRFDLVFNFDYSNRTKDSEFRYYVDDQGLPITQSTKFSQTPLTAGIKFLLLPRGRQIGQYTWLPNRVVPFLSGGAGVLWYEFKQSGDFVDYETLEIFSSILESSGSVPSIYLGCGVDFNIFKATYITLDFKYSWADDDLDQDFVEFDPIDLSGIRITTGIHWHF
jgi:hypothetical protein